MADYWPTEIAHCAHGPSTDLIAQSTPVPLPTQVSEGGVFTLISAKSGTSRPNTNLLLTAVWTNTTIQPASTSASSTSTGISVQNGESVYPSCSSTIWDGSSAGVVTCDSTLFSSELLLSLQEATGITTSLSGPCVGFPTRAGLGADQGCVASSNHTAVPSSSKLFQDYGSDNTSWARNPDCTASWLAFHDPDSSNPTSVILEPYTTVVPPYGIVSFGTDVLENDEGSSVTHTSTASITVLKKVKQNYCCGQCKLQYSNVVLYYWPEDSFDLSCTYGAALARANAPSIQSNETANYTTAENAKVENQTAVGDLTMSRTYITRSIANSTATNMVASPARTINPRAPSRSSMVTPTSFGPGVTETPTFIKGNYTFTKPSVYVVYNKVTARDNCGGRGTFHDAITIPFAQGELSVLEGTLRAYTKIKALDFNYIPCNPDRNWSASPQEWQSVLALPKKLQGYDPLWKHCVAFNEAQSIDSPQSILPMDWHTSNMTTGHGGMVLGPQALKTAAQFVTATASMTKTRIGLNIAPGSLIDSEGLPQPEVTQGASRIVTTLQQTTYWASSTPKSSIAAESNDPNSEISTPPTATLIVPPAVDSVTPGLSSTNQNAQSSVPQGLPSVVANPTLSSSTLQGVGAIIMSAFNFNPAQFMQTKGSQPTVIAQSRSAIANPTPGSLESQGVTAKTMSEFHPNEVHSSNGVVPQTVMILASLEQPRMSQASREDSVSPPPLEGQRQSLLDNSNKATSTATLTKGEQVTSARTPVSINSNYAVGGGASVTSTSELETVLKILPVGGQVITASTNGGIAVGGSLVHPGQRLTIAGIPISVGVSYIVIAGSTSTLPATPQTVLNGDKIAANLANGDLVFGETISYAVLDGKSFTFMKSAPAGTPSLVVGGSTLVPGAAPITLNGQELSWGKDGNLVVGSETVTVSSFLPYGNAASNADFQPALAIGSKTYFVAFPSTSISNLPVAAHVTPPPGVVTSFNSAIASILNASVATFDGAIYSDGAHVKNFGSEAMPSDVSGLVSNDTMSLLGSSAGQSISTASPKLSAVDAPSNPGAESSAQSRGTRGRYTRWVLTIAVIVVTIFIML